LRNCHQNRCRCAGVTGFPQNALVIELKIEVARADIALVGNDELKAVGFIDVL
jgi:hypothetical protein